eukprot:357270-Chlamydomonas_euryale.AAC.8
MASSFQSYVMNHPNARRLAIGVSQVQSSSTTCAMHRIISKHAHAQRPSRSMRMHCSPPKACTCATVFPHLSNLSFAFGHDFIHDDHGNLHAHPCSRLQLHVRMRTCGSQIRIFLHGWTAHGCTAVATSAAATQLMHPAMHDPRSMLTALRSLSLARQRVGLAVRLWRT